MPTILHLTVENPDELRNSGAYDTGALIRVQSSATEGGTYAALSGTGSTPTVTLVAATRAYTAYDPAGTVSTWYRTRYENAGATRVSDWSTSFQTGDETGGYLVSLYDVKQELNETGTANDETIQEKIRQVSIAIEGYCGRWFVPRPLSGTTTYTFHTSPGLRLRVPKGIRSITTLGLAVSGQPETGGTYTTQAAANYFLDPLVQDRDPGWPAIAVCLRYITGARFYAAEFGVQITGKFGWAEVPADIQGVALRAVVRRYLGKGGGGPTFAVGPAGTEFMLPDMSGADRKTLDWYKDHASTAVGS